MKLSKLFTALSSGGPRHVEMTAMSAPTTLELGYAEVSMSRLLLPLQLLLLVLLVVEVVLVILFLFLVMLYYVVLQRLRFVVVLLVCYCLMFFRCNI